MVRILIAVNWMFGDSEILGLWHRLYQTEEHTSELLQDK